VATIELAVTPAVAHDDRPEFYINAAAAGLGVLVLVVLPPKVIFDHPRLERNVLAQPPGADPCVLLADAERMLLRVARDERFITSWLVHVGNFALNIGVALGVGFSTGNWERGALDGALGALVGELQINLAPTGSAEGLERYRRGDLAPLSPPRTLSLSPMGGGAMGLRLGITF
jgi:hypothetical protein